MKNDDEFFNELQLGYIEVQQQIIELLCNYRENLNTLFKKTNNNHYKIMIYACIELVTEQLLNMPDHKEREMELIFRSATIREMEIIALIYKGFTQTQISQKLCISINTLKNHLKNIIQKLQDDTEINEILVQHGIKLNNSYKTIKEISLISLDFFDTGEKCTHLRCLVIKSFFEFGAKRLIKQVSDKDARQYITKILRD